MGNTQGSNDHSPHLERRETWSEKAKDCLDSIVDSLREEEVSLLPKRRETSSHTRQSVVVDVGDDMSFSSIASVFTRRFSRAGGVAPDVKEEILVNFHYNSLDDALRKSKKYKMPVLSVAPGMRRGDMASPSCHHALSHPLLAEAAEALFITVAPEEIYEEVYVSTRIIDGLGKDVTDEQPLDLWSNAGMALAMARALKTYKTRVPIYLKMLLELETGRIRVGRGGTVYKVEKKAVFGVADASDAEVVFAGLDGVLGTNAGRIAEQQVVQLMYNSSKLSISKLVRFALENDVAQVVYYNSNDDRIPAQMEINRARAQTELLELSGSLQEDNDLSKHALRETLLRYIPLTSLQATRANRLVAEGKFDQVSEEILSPRQAMLLRRLMHSTRREVFADVVDVPIRLAWKQLPDWVNAQLTGTSFRRRSSTQTTKNIRPID